MHRFSPLLISMIVLASLLAHHVHGPVAMADAPAPAVTAGHLHHGVQALQVIDHGALDDIVPELCTIGDPATPAFATLQGHVAVALASSGVPFVQLEPASAPIWETPVSPPDVLRAFLQVYLN